METIGSLSRREEQEVQEYADAVVSKMIVMTPPDYIPAYFFDKFDEVILTSLKHERWSSVPPRLVPNGLFASFERLWKVIYDGANNYSIGPGGHDLEKRKVVLQVICKTMKTSPKRGQRR